MAIPELSEGPVAAAESAVRAHSGAVRPTLATLAFVSRAHGAWQAASQAVEPEVRGQLMAEGKAWALRATRAARSLQRALPPPTDDDRALRALLRTALGVLQEPDPTTPLVLQALQQLDAAARGLGRNVGVPLTDPLGPGGRHDVPGFLARITGGRERTLLGVLAFVVPAVGLGLLYLAMAD